MADIKRLHYFNHQFLVEADFTDEQTYHLEMRRRLNAALHGFGAGDGLAVTRSGDKEVTVTAGIAVDREGREAHAVGWIRRTTLPACSGSGSCTEQ